MAFAEQFRAVKAFAETLFAVKTLSNKIDQDMGSQNPIWPPSIFTRVNVFDRLDDVCDLRCNDKN